jgi:hypothetical protein
MPALSGAVELNFDFVLREKGAGNGAFYFLTCLRWAKFSYTIRR